jgi:cell division protein ZapB
MSQIADLAERVERLLLRHEEIKRENLLLQAQLSAVTTERDSLRSRLYAARMRIDALIERLPIEASPAAAEVSGSASEGATSSASSSEQPGETISPGDAR